MTFDSHSLTICDITLPGIRANAIENKKATTDPMPAYCPVLLAFVSGSPWGVIENETSGFFVTSFSIAESAV